MKLDAATPEFPVADLTRALAYYRDVLGFKVAWVNEAARLAGVAHGRCVIFLREGRGVSQQVIWVFSDDVDATHDVWAKRGAMIAEPPESKPWGLRQFTLRDLDGHEIIVHHDR